MATYDPRQTFKAQQAAFGRASGVTQQQEAKKAKTSFASGSTYDEVPQVLTKGLGSRSDKPKKEEKSLDRKIYEYFMDAGAKVDEPEQNVFALPVYERSMFKIPAVTEVTTQGIKDPFDQFSADTYQFGGYDDTREAAPQVTQTQDPDMQDPRKGLMSAPTMDQPSTPEALTGIPRGLALGNATPSKSYLIKDGDTLSQIAKDNNTTVKAILNLNSEIEDKNVIDAGARIEIPLSDTQAALRGGLNREKNNEGVQTASSGDIITDTLNSLKGQIQERDTELDPMSAQEASFERMGIMSPTKPQPVDAITAATTEKTNFVNTFVERMGSVDEGREDHTDNLGITTLGYGVLPATARSLGYDPDSEEYQDREKLAKVVYNDMYDNARAEYPKVFNNVTMDQAQGVLSMYINLGEIPNSVETALSRDDPDFDAAKEGLSMNILGSPRNDDGSRKVVDGKVVYTSNKGLSKRRAREYNTLMEGDPNYKPITTVSVEGSRASPTFVWEDADGNEVNRYTPELNNDEVLYQGLDSSNSMRTVRVD